MKKSIWLLMIALMAVAVTSCKKDSYSREDFVGNWDATESIIISGQTNTRSYSFNVILDPGNIDRIIMNSYGDLQGAAISATVSGNTFKTEKLNITFNGNSATFEGSGTIDGNKITYSNVILSNGVNTTFNGTATKK
jgi:hypothetical protein